MSREHQSSRRRGATARANGKDRPAPDAAATPGAAQDAPDASPASDDPTPLEIMRAAMCWAQHEAKRRSANPAVHVTKAENQATALIAGLWALALNAAREAAPYHHARPLPAPPRDPTQRSHEEWVAWFEEEEARERERKAAGEAGD
jgi:hypothetical protein